LTLARTLGDRLGEAKASGNLGNTLKVLGKFDEAIVCCTRHLDISRELTDKVGEARALYNLGNVYHAKGKHAGRNLRQDPGEFPAEVRQSLERAAEFYEANLEIVKELSDKAAQGRACGNLGNTHYLLGNFDKAIKFHKERMVIAQEFGDKSAERRAYSNLGNAHVFLGEFDTATGYYKKTLAIAKELGDRAIEAQACYSLGNTFTLLKDYTQACEYHMKHLDIAQDLGDRIGEGRACWSLGNAHTALGNHEIALEYAQRHLEISKQVGDRTGQMTAQMNIADLKAMLGIGEGSRPDKRSHSYGTGLNADPGSNSPNTIRELFELKTVDQKHAKKEAMKQFSLDESRPKSSRPWLNTRSKSTPVETSEVEVDLQRTPTPPEPSASAGESSLDESFFDMISHYQGNRMDEQRCMLPPRAEINGGILKPPHQANSTSSENLLDLLVRVQGDRMNEQRCALPDELPGLTSPKASVQSAPGKRLFRKMKDSERLQGATVPDDDFYEMVLRCQGQRMEDQRTEAPPAPTVPDEDFFSLIVRLQSNRMDEQRVSLPKKQDKKKHKDH